ARRGMLISNDTQVFMEHITCKVIGITGSAGKTTTTTLAGRMAQADPNPKGRVWVGGNIGLPLIDHVESIQPEDLVILELSSFQLEQMTISPQVAAILNISPNHLDRHGTMSAYQAAKARILDFQTQADTAVLNIDDADTWGLRGRVKGRLVTFGLEHDPALDGCTLVDDEIVWRAGGDQVNLLPRSAIKLRGRHNLMNVMAACAVVLATGVGAEAPAAGVTDFSGVPHRIQWVRKHHGVDWYNDSIATSPERVIAAIQSFEEPLVLMLGGRDKQLPWQALANLICERIDHVVVFGEAGEMIEAVISETKSGDKPYSIQRCQQLETAVQAAADVAGEGQVVLFSPGCTSYDEFKDFEERGERFAQWVNQLT
ncbi:MAG: UDP-N-acetylmuramoyl-L-alanine--D-glutamate ligase, partial [Anaerolineae bacterium]|nr:UDP-N-acetylmuramoyl-L-alanine--D-glutamate ligase [Anaerolineae bacterium]